MSGGGPASGPSLMPPPSSAMPMLSSRRIGPDFDLDGLGRAVAHGVAQCFLHHAIGGFFLGPADAGASVMVCSKAMSG